MNRGRRFLLFALMIVLGVAGGVTYAWVIDPVQYEDTSPDRLHPNYKADYVLMVAEIYQADQDLQAAVGRLSFLGGQPSQTATEGLLTARKLNYAVSDLELLNQLALALQGATPTPSTEAQP